MASKKKRLRKDIIKIWADTTGSTADRTTKYNDLCDRKKVTESYASLTWVKARADIIA